MSFREDMFTHTEADAAAYEHAVHGGDWDPMDDTPTRAEADADEWGS